MESSKPATPQPQPLRNERSEDFISVYANNVMFESSAFDLRLIYGQIDQAAGVVDQHTGVTIPWVVAKLGLHFLNTQVAAHEIVYGKIAIPKELFPLEPPPPPKELSQNPLVQQVYEALKKLREEFIKTA